MLWKLLANLQRHHSFDKHSLMVCRVRADAEHKVHKEKRKSTKEKRSYEDYEFIAIRSPLEIETRSGQTIDVPACAGHFSLCLVERDLDTDKMLQSIEQVSHKVAAYLRTIVYADDDQGRFTVWLNRQAVGIDVDEMTDTQFDRLARKYYHVAARDLRNIRTCLADFAPNRLAHV